MAELIDVDQILRHYGGTAADLSPQEAINGMNPPPSPLSLPLPLPLQESGLGTSTATDGGDGEVASSSGSSGSMGGTRPSSMGAAPTDA